MTRKTTNQTPVILAHRRLVVLEARYTREPTNENNLALCRTQRVYYRRFMQYQRAVHEDRRTPQEAVTRITKALLVRAQQNRRRLPNNEQWQEMALYQVRRATAMHRRAQALGELE